MNDWIPWPGLGEGGKETVWWSKKKGVGASERTIDKLSGVFPRRRTQADLLSWDPVLKLGHQCL